MWNIFIINILSALHPKENKSAIQKVCKAILRHIKSFAQDHKLFAQPMDAAVAGLRYCGFMALAVF